MFQLFETNDNSKGKGFDYISLLIYAYIYSFTHKAESHKWYGKQQELAKLVHASEQSVCNKLKDLVDKGLIKCERVELYGMFHHNNYTTAGEHGYFSDIPVQQELTAVQQERTVVQQELTNNISIYKSIDKSNDKEEVEKSSPSLHNESSVPKERNKDISDSTAATSVRTQVYATYPELAGVIIKWYNEVGIKKKLSFNQIKDKVETLKEECNGDAKLAEQQINYSYMNGYLAWYPPKNINKKQKDNVIIKNAKIGGILNEL